MKRTVDILVLSDTHLGTFGARAKTLLKYLNTIEPKMLIVNGDLIDIWQFTRLYFPKAHLDVLKKIMDFIRSGIPVYYLTGNHDNLLRKFTPLYLGNFQLIDELELEIGGQRTWIIHGDKYDKTIKARFPAIVGGTAYHCLIIADRLFNRFTGFFGIRPIRISKGLKDFSKRMAKKVNDFEQEALDLAIEQGYDSLICGHIHRYQMRTVTTEKGSIFYLNSGDWVENASSLEFNNGEWRIFRFEVDFETNEVATEKVNL